MKQFGPEDEAPVNNVSWYDAAAYCNWLSEQEGLPEKEWCYEKNQAGKLEPGMKLAPNYLRRTGYRLPMEAQCEYACRAGAETAYTFGEGADMLGHYAWHDLNSEYRAHPVGLKKPNDRGLFDVHGNLRDWCQEGSAKYDINEIDNTIEDKEDILDINDNDHRSWRGGTFFGQAVIVRCAVRLGDVPANHHSSVGFRPARTVTP